MSKIYSALALLPLLLAAPAHAQPTTLYAQNFNSPATTSCGAWGGSGSDSSLSSDYNGLGQVGSAAFTQVGTADRVCWGKALNTDPDNTATPYSGGFARNGAVVESWAIAFDPQGKPFINGLLDLAHVTPGNLNGTAGSTNYPGTAGSVQMGLRFFRIPSGSNFNLAPGAATPIASPANPANLVISGITQTPLPESGLVDVTKDASYSRYAADWSKHQFSVDTSSFLPGDRLAMVGTVIENLTYIVFDNLVITSDVVPSNPPSISKSFGAPQVNLGQSTTLTINVTGNGISPVNGLTVTDNLPAPVVMSAGGVLSNTCGGTLVAGTGSNQIQLTNGVLPAAGCQLQLEVQWPSAAAAQCSGSPVTNTIVDGTDFTVGSTTTAGINAQATLACPAPPVLPQVSVSCIPKVLVDAPGQVSSCVIMLNASQLTDLTVNLQPPATNPRYTSTCQNAMVVPAGSTNASCTIEAVANSITGDGDVTATLSILDSAAYTVGSRTDSVEIRNDDEVLPPSSPTSVPTIGGLGLLLLSGVVAGSMGLMRRRKSN